MTLTDHPLIRTFALASTAVMISTMLAVAFDGTALASGGTKLCVPSAQGKPIVTLKAGVCKAGYTLTELGAEGKEGKQGLEGKQGTEGKQGPEGKNEFTAEEIVLLKSVLPHIKYLDSGVAGKPTIQFSGVNVQVVSGAGATGAAINGEGNLVIGYDENGGAHEQTGSHNLILGEEQTFTSFGGIVAGLGNKVSAEFASVTGGQSNSATEPASSVSGGSGNRASGRHASVSAGLNNAASGSRASVSGGIENAASGEGASVSGGRGNAASGQTASVGGGTKNNATALATSVSGGFENKAGVEEKGSFAWVGGGARNIASGSSSSIFGGEGLKAENTFEAIP